MAAQQCRHGNHPIFCAPCDVELLRERLVKQIVQNVVVSGMCAVCKKPLGCNSETCQICRAFKIKNIQFEEPLADDELETPGCWYIGY